MTFDDTKGTRIVSDSQPHDPRGSEIATVCSDDACAVDLRGLTL